MKKNPYRLGKELTPVLYDLFFEPDLDDFTFNGRMTLFFTLAKSTSKIVLNAADLKVRSAVFLSGSSHPADIRAKKISYDAKLETVTFHFPRRLPAGKGRSLRVEFSGRLNDKMHGFYRTSYSVPAGGGSASGGRGQQRWGAATQFEATDARRAFPCVDEPDRKARFSASVRIPRHLTALSNMPVEKETSEKRSGKKILLYETTPIMPTYLLCFVIAELECLKGKDKDGVPIGIWTTPGKKEQGRFALEVAKHTLPYFSEWFGIPYALPKLDMVALPDFASGAMENWGLVTYRETALLVDAKNSSASAKQRVAEVIDHELAHQWFGNLVTMEWWTDLWLNEGFASYMGPKAVDHQFPEWKIWSQYIATEYLTALHDDALKNSHPIEIPVQNPHEIREIFDHITYNKGSAVNRMLEHYLGEKVFRRGLRRYLKRYAYRNARTVDLWKALEEVSGEPVRAIMASYTRQEGYPVLTVDKKVKNKKIVLEIEQKRFIFDGSADLKRPVWKVPVTVAVQGQTKVQTAVLNSRRVSVPLPGKETGWVKLNPGQSGFYRASYSPEMLKRLTEAMSRQEISVIDRMGVLDDAIAQARAGLLKTSGVLDLLRVCRDQSDYNLWLTISGIVGSVEHIAPETVQENIASFARELFAEIGSRCGWEGRESDTHLERLLRSLVISRLGHFGDWSVVGEAQTRFTRFIKKGPLDPNLRGAVYGIVAEHGAHKEFQQLRQLYKGTDLQEEKVRLLRALTRFRSKTEIRQVLEFSLSKEVRAQDTYVILAGFGSNVHARQSNWDFVKARWKDIHRRYNSGSVGILGHILEGSTCGFKDQDHFQDVRRFFKAHPVQGTERTRKQALEIIESNMAWSSRDAGDIQAWLESL